MEHSGPQGAQGFQHYRTENKKENKPDYPFFKVVMYFMSSIAIMTVAFVEITIGRCFNFTSNEYAGMIIPTIVILGALVYFNYELYSKQ